ncbi:MAG: efflux RND transporter periplasmic adaptor subunit [Gemmatimonadaceae bacterium]
MLNGPRTESPRRVWSVVAFVAVIAGAAGVAWWATHDRSTVEREAEGGHDHAAMPVGVGGTDARVVLTAEQARRIGVTFATVTMGMQALDIHTVGQLVVDETRVTIVATKVDGWVERLHADYTGQLVRAGAPLLELYAPMVVTAQEELLLAGRLVRDVADGDSVTRADAADLVASARRRLAWWDVPEEEIARVERTGEATRTVTLRVPSSGIVLEKHVEAGQRIIAGEALYRVADLGTLWVEGEIYEQDLRSVRVGQVAIATFDAFPGERWTGRVAFVHPTLSTDTRTARVRVVLQNPGLRLKPGMYASLQLAGAARPTVLTVPRSAVLATGERAIVFVRLPAGRLEPRPVTVGGIGDGRVEIVAGLAVGDVVVASATFLIDAESNLGTALGGMGEMPGMEITIPPADAPPARTPR